MEIDLFFLVVASVGVLIAAISKTGFGGGASFVATPILALVIDPAMALGIMLPLLMLMDVTGLKAYWGKWSNRDTWRLCVGALPGIVIAALVYRLTDPDVFRFLIGAISVGFVFFQLAVRAGWITARDAPLGKGAGLLAGVGAGFTSFVAHAGGPAAVVYLLSQGLSKLVFQATTVIVFSVVNATKAVIYAGLGFFTPDALKIALILAPVAFLGAVLGVRANKIVPERVFFGLTYVLLAVVGTKLIWESLT